jgi:hypothetical protein
MNMSTRTSSTVPGSAFGLLGGRSGMRMEYTRTLQMRRSDLDHYLIEMLDQDTWIEGVRSMLAEPRLSGHPWPHFRGEHQVWL